MMKVFGLDNIHYTCYLNSTLQCLFTFSKLRDELLKESVEDKDIIGALVKIMTCEKDALRTNGLKRLIKSLMVKVTWFTFLQHNDVNEFIMLFFEQLNMEIYEKNKVASKEFPLKLTKYDEKTMHGYFLNKAQKSWVSFVKNEHTWFNELVTGQLVNQVICGNCKKIHHNFETFRVLDIEIPDNGDLSIDTCLSQYFSKHHINDDEDLKNKSDKWVCDVCKQSSKSLKTCKLVRLPEMLVISIKRFKYNERTGSFLKNNANIKISDVLDIDQYSVCNEPDYQLMSFANHMGNMHGGHYNATCNYDDQWLLIDDESVSKIKTYDDRNAYTIFYKKMA